MSLRNIYPTMMVTMIQMIIEKYVILHSENKKVEVKVKKGDE